MRMRDEKGIDDKIVAVSVRDPAFADYTDKAQLPPPPAARSAALLRGLQGPRAQAGDGRGHARTAEAIAIIHEALALYRRLRGASWKLVREKSSGATGRGAVPGAVRGLLHDSGLRALSTRMDRGAVSGVYRLAARPRRCARRVPALGDTLLLPAVADRRAVRAPAKSSFASRSAVRRPPRPPGLSPIDFAARGPERRPTFLQVDFGLVRDAAGIEPRLVELQAFPSLYGFQSALADAYAWPSICGPASVRYLCGLDARAIASSCATPSSVRTIRRRSC